jgi:endonuclease YncB( thermonuclease family)
MNIQAVFYTSTESTKAYAKVSGLSRKRNKQQQQQQQQQTLVEKQHKGLWRQNSLFESQNSATTAPSCRELYHMQFSLQVASPETFGCTLV